MNFDKPEINLAIGDQYVDGTTYHNDFAAAGFFGRINYDYMGKYLLEVNARYDGSSKFPSGDQWALFPSVSAGWRLSEETFMKWAKPVLSDFKVRGSWGTIGNQDVAANSFLSVMSVNKSSGWVIDGKQVPYIGIPSVVSPSLTWERVTTIDLGFDARFSIMNLVSVLTGISVLLLICIHQVKHCLLLSEAQQCLRLIPGNYKDAALSCQ